jgi:hypothetical protein
MRGAQGLYKRLRDYIRQNGLQETGRSSRPASDGKHCRKGTVQTLNGRVLEGRTIEDAAREIRNVRL